MALPAFPNASGHYFHCNSAKDCDVCGENVMACECAPCDECGDKTYAPQLQCFGEWEKACLACRTSRPEDDR